MSAFADARSELATALDDAGVRVDAEYGGDPPYVVLFSDGIADMTGVQRGAVTWGFRIAMVGGGFTDPARDGELDVLRTLVLGAVRALAGWRVDRLERDVLRDVAGGRVLAADLIVSCMVAL